MLGAGVHLNVDLLTQLDRVGARAPGSTVGIRINPRIGAAYPGGGQTYAGDRPTKFGIYPERLGEALDIARRHDLTIDTVHVHAGYLYLTDALPIVDETMRRVAEATRSLMDAGCPIVEVNTGGGLGVPFRPGDEPLDLEAWASVLARHLGPLDVSVGTEPGEFLAKQCAVHLAEVVSVEDRDGTTFIGLDTGWNVINEHFVYRIPLPPDPVSSGRRRARGAASPWPGTSTRGTTCSPRTIPCPRSRRATSSRSRTSARTTRR